MLIKVSPALKHYHWAADGIIRDYVQEEIPDTTAEAWYGLHPDGIALDEGKEPIDKYVNKLSFMVKLLAAGQPLSIQVHPDKSQAFLGWTKESASEKPMQDRIYKDQSDKPEMLIALKDNFMLMAGFRSVEESHWILESLIRTKRDAKIIEHFQKILDNEPHALLNAIYSKMGKELNRILKRNYNQVPEIKKYAEVIFNYAYDNGVLFIIFLNTLSLKKNEVAYIPSGMPHAYINGFGYEVLANSDNVVRGGLTTKPVNIEEFIKLTKVDYGQNVKLIPSVQDYGLLYKFDQNFQTMLVEDGKTVIIDKGSFITVLENNSGLAFDGEKAITKRGDTFLATEDTKITPARTQLLITNQPA